MILYFSGTGNSGYAARRIADGLGEPLLCLNDLIQHEIDHCEGIVI